MKIKTSQKLMSLNDESLKDNLGKELTLKDVCIEALLLNYNNDQATGLEKFKRYEVASKIKQASDEAELTIEEMALIKDLVGRAYGASVVGPVFSMIEGAL